MSDFNLGTVTAYGYAKDKGYTGTEDEYAELMASYADVAEQAAESATQAAASATTATAKASEAAQSATAAASSKTAAETAQGGAETAAQTATTKAGEATTAATTATNKATEATTAAGTATTKASEATTAATTATTKAGEASTSATNAAASATRAQEILDSIPEDYSQLSEDVSDLKDGLTAVESDVTDLKEDMSQSVNDLKSALTYKADKVYGGDTTATYYNAAGGKSWTNGGLYVNVSNRAASDPIRYTPDMKSVDVTSGYRAAVFGNNEGAGHPITLFGNWFLPFISLSNFPYDYIFVIIRSEPEGDITTDLRDVLSISKYDAAYEFALKKDLDETDENLTDSEDSIKLRCDISGTIQTPVYDSEGRLIKIEHTSDGSVVRTDAFTYSGNVITETRTLSNGKTLAYIYYLETNIVEVD